ncbi:LysM peptidoglycan-binding domain-containing protein [Streptomyces sp. SID5789]|uniref:LysM peptidoglycan-binding domain-containing protein n=1 Tax=Streptomyces sp. SID5789 TaxID=2690310 RepID=UPI00136A71C8|nr:LysM peptidoglycan-binding domain-containing protein [Streptomyces sp. SID5789]MZE74650.1 LysM peptidoglycan-binding domain-containing protein [Streptomyces sp. SID5789]
MRHAPAPATAGRTPLQVITGVVSLLVLAGALVGMPLLLAWASPVIWAFTHDDLAHLLDRQDTGAAFLALLLVVGWAGWIQFAFCAVRELAAQLRGHTWRVPRGFGASQRAAAALIGSILVLLPASSALATDAHAAATATDTRLPSQAGEQPVTDQGRPGSGTTSALPVHTVRAGESLWSIAEQELGDGEKWRQIAALNEGHAMADGQVFQSNSFLQAGWQLQMPAGHAFTGGDRTQLTAKAAAADEASVHTVAVEEGDNLSKIAEEELGDSDQWPDLFAASRGTPQPGGLPAITDPDVIYPGQQITVRGQQRAKTPPSDSDRQERTPPTTQTPGSEQTRDRPAPDTGQTPPPERTPAPATSPAPTTPSSPSGGQPSPQRSPSATTPATPQPATSAPSTSPSPSTPASPAQTPETTATSTDPAPPAPARADRPLNLRLVFGCGALLAAAVTGALALRRMLQRRRRKPGETIAIAAETSPAEAQLAAVAEPGGAARLDVALRTMAHHAAQQEGGAAVPVVRAARIGARTLHVLPEDFSPPSAPFVAGERGWWVLDADAVLLDEEDARDVPAPCPGLVTIGSTEKGDLVLLNLARTSALLLDGNPVHISEVCTSLALELGMSPWASDVEIVTVGFGEDLPQLLPTARIAHMRQPAHALRDLAERLLEAHQLPDTAHQPYLLLCASGLDADTAWEFADVIDKAGDVPVTLVAPASTAAPHFPDAEILNASLATPQPLETADHEVTVQRLEHAAYLQITTALRVAAQPAHEAQGAWKDVPDEPAHVEQSEQEVQPAAPGPVAADSGDAVAQDSSEAGGEVFPALLAAATDPASLRLLPSIAPTLQAQGESTPGTGTPAAPTAQPPGSDDDKPAAEPAASAASTTAKEGAAAGTAQDLHAPEIRVLGPIEVTGVASTGHGPRLAQLATLLFFRPGRSSETLCSDMDPASPWHLSTLNARMQGLRRSLGNDLDGNPYVPRRKTGQDPYRLSPAVRCDWTRFLQLVERALPTGPAGLGDLEKALSLVRGQPFGGAPLPWAEPYQQEITTRIIDVAHTVATYRTSPGPHHDLSAARQAVATGLDVDHTAELLYRDWCRLEHAAGNRQGLHTAITRIQQINRELDCSMETETEQLIKELLNRTPQTGDLTQQRAPRQNPTTRA